MFYNVLHHNSQCLTGWFTGDGRVLQRNTDWLRALHGYEGVALWSTQQSGMCPGIVPLRRCHAEDFDPNRPTERIWIYKITTILTYHLQEKGTFNPNPLPLACNVDWHGLIFSPSASGVRHRTHELLSVSTLQQWGREGCESANNFSCVRNQYRYWRDKTKIWKFLFPGGWGASCRAGKAKARVRATARPRSGARGKV